MTSSVDQPWHVLGGGSIGCLLTLRLHLAGEAPTLILRDARSAALARDRLALIEAETEMRVPGVRAISALDVNAPVPRLFICTKAHQTETALEPIAPALTASPLLVLLQNGMGVGEHLHRRWPHATILYAITTEGAYQHRRFAVVHAGHGITQVGSASEEAASQHNAGASVTALLNRVGLAARHVPDMTRPLWEKLAVNSIINPLTAIYRCPNGALFDQAGVTGLATRLCVELAAVSQACGVPLASDAVLARARAVAAATGGNRSSMLQDVEANRATEIDFINGFVVDQARIHGLQVPNHAALLAHVKSLRPSNTA